MAVENLLKFIGLTISMWMITLRFTSQLGRCICIVSISPYHLCCGFLNQSVSLSFKCLD